jgi:aspartate 1-decarboxylase
MQRQMLKSKIHRATITDCDVDYIGSITLDPELMRRADLLVNEQVHVWDIDNGARFVTYAIEGEEGSGTVQVNGAAARLVRNSDKVIIASFGAFDESDLERYSPVVVHVDDRNEVVAVDSDPTALLGGVVMREGSDDARARESATRITSEEPPDSSEEALL